MANPDTAQQGIISSAIGPTTSYNGQQVIGKDNQQFMAELQNGVDTLKAATGKEMSLMDYDKMANPTTYGARWGIAADQMPAAAPAPAVAPAAAPAPKAAGSGPATWTVTPEQTVEGRIQSIINGGSPIIASARAGAVDQMNARGLSNSSLATTASDAAAYQAAIPIAGADAATFAKAGATNADAQNQFAMQGRQLQSAADIAKLQSQTAITTTGMNTETALAQTRLSTEAQKSIAALSNQTQTQINTDLNANRVLLQNSQAAVNLANQYALNVGNIEASTTMDAAAKQAAIQSQRDIFNQSVAAITKASPGIPDVSSTLVFNNAPATGSPNSTDGGATQNQVANTQ